MVCNDCWDLGTDPGSVDHLRYGKMLEFKRDTTAQGNICMWCDMLVQVWNEHPDNEDWRLSGKKLEDAIIHLHAPNPQDMRFRSFEFAFHEPNENGQASEPASQYCRTFVVKLSAEQTDAQSDMFNFIKESIRLCESVHPENCRVLDINSLERLPTRLLEIEAKEGGRIRLVECQDRFQDPNSFPVRYAALSHSWGPGDQLKTTGSNLENVKDQIHWEHLPATFQNAIKVCRHLSTRKAKDQDSLLNPVEYLWIDSLCIIQDSCDFDVESVKMCDYYGNAFITISGTSSQKSNEGFLEIPNYLYKPWAMILAGSEIEVRRAEDHEANWHGANTSLYGDGSRESLKVRHPTFDRGWIFQENSLARRTIHFTKLGVIYECSHPNINLRLRAENTALLRGTKDNFNRIQIRSHNSAAAYSTWHKCVEKYFPLSLKEESDRLIAIGGLAQRISQNLNDSLRPDTYLAGLWGRNIAAGLCWRLDRNDGCLPATISTNPASSRDIHSEYYVAPSWSWASVRGSRLHITSTSRYFESMVDLETHDLTAKKGCFGKIESCSINLFAPKREMRISWATNRDPRLDSIIATELHGEAVERPLRVFIDTVLHVSTRDTVQRGNRQQEGLLGQGHEAIVHCVLVGRDDTKIHGLVLTNAVRSKNAFARVGYFRTDNLLEMDRQGQTFVESFKKTKVTII